MATRNETPADKDDWMPVGTFATVTEAARRIVELEGIPKNGLKLLGNLRPRVRRAAGGHGAGGKSGSADWVADGGRGGVM